MTTSPELTTTNKMALPAHFQDMLDDTKQAVQAKAKQVNQHLQKAGETAQGKAGEATQQATSAANKALAKLPTAVSGRVEQLAGTVRNWPVPAAAVLIGVLALLVLRLVLRRNR